MLPTLSLRAGFTLISRYCKRNLKRTLGTYFLLGKDMTSRLDDYILCNETWQQIKSKHFYSSLVSLMTLVIFKLFMETSGDFVIETSSIRTTSHFAFIQSQLFTSCLMACKDLEE